MRIDAVVLPAEGTDEVAELVLRQVEAGHVQQWMLLYQEPTDDVFVVAAPPTAVHVDTAGGRPQRWVHIPLIGVDEPLEVKATARVDIVYGADLEGLAPLLDPDLYAEEEEGLARNGMCHELAPATEGQPDDDEPVYCGRPSIPGSFYRACTAHDENRIVDSDELVSRQFEPTYGPPIAP